MSIIDSLKKKIEVASKAQGKTKFFAYCEVVLFPLSLLIILVLILYYQEQFLLYLNLIKKQILR